MFLGQLWRYLCKTIICLVLLFAVWTFGYGSYEVYHLRAQMQHWPAALAKVSSVTVIESTGKSGTHYIPYIYVNYDYLGLHYGEIKLRSDLPTLDLVSRSLSDAEQAAKSIYPASGTLNILVNPSDPTHVYLDSDRSKPLNKVYVFAAVFFAVLLYGVLTGVFSNRKKRRG